MVGFLLVSVQTNPKAYPGRRHSHCGIVQGLILFHRSSKVRTQPKGWFGDTSQNVTPIPSWFARVYCGFGASPLWVPFVFLRERDLN